jgi:hypothetical protein
MGRSFFTFIDLLNHDNLCHCMLIHLNWAFSPYYTIPIEFSNNEGRNCSTHFLICNEVRFFSTFDKF